MYLTRIQLDLTKTKTMQALVAPKLFHGAIECAVFYDSSRIA